MSKFIRFERAAELHGGRACYWIINKRAGDIIGRVLWYPAWRSYVCEFSPGSVWSAGCLDDVSARLKELAAGKETT